MAAAIPSTMVLQSGNNPTLEGYVYYNEKDGSVLYGEKNSVFSTLVKIVVERSEISNNYVHLRFGHSNRYWQRKENDKYVVAVSTKPEEDTTKPSCTLFELQIHDSTRGTFDLRHVPSGWRGRVEIEYSSTGALFVNDDSIYVGNWRSVDWDTLVKLPTHVAFKGDNDQYLRVQWVEGHPYLLFNSSDANEVESGHMVNLMPDGYVRIISDSQGQFWRRSPNWIWADSSDTTANNKDTLFWPFKIDDNTIALQNAGNNLFCERLDAEGKYNALNAASATIVSNARLQVEELVLERKIHNVRYLMQDARIFDEMPFVAGSAVVTNNGDTEASIAVELTYQEERSYTFSRSMSLTAGVSTTIEAGVPLITSASITVEYQISGTFQWDETTTTTKSVKATGSAPVPPKSTAVVSYVGTKGTCNIPYHYSQQDKSSTDGKITQTDQIDGIYTGVNCFNFNFVIDKTKSLDADMWSSPTITF